MKSKGLGDTIEKVTKATGIKKLVETVSKARHLANQKENVPVIVAPLEKLSSNHFAITMMIRNSNMFFINDENWRKYNLTKKIKLPMQEVICFHS